MKGVSHHKCYFPCDYSYTETNLCQKNASVLTSGWQKALEAKILSFLLFLDLFNLSGALSCINIFAIFAFSTVIVFYLGYHVVLLYDLLSLCLECS